MKPANVLVGKNGTLKVTDFGISDTQARQALEEARHRDRHRHDLHHAFTGPLGQHAHVRLAPAKERGKTRTRPTTSMPWA